jgi:iron complex outermembrane receptor protein
MTGNFNLRDLYALLLPASILTLVGSSAAYAQQSTGNVYATQSGANELEEITVTARKRAELVEDVPSAVTAFSREDLQQLGVTAPQDFMNATPGVFFRTQTTAGLSFINIRGITQARNAESPVAIVVDDVVLNNPLSFEQQMVDLKQVEVLKGPQGALFGRNAEAGAVLITTEAPTSTWGGYAKAGYGRDQWSQAEGAFGGPLADDLNFRVVGYHYGTDGYLPNEFFQTGPRGGTNYADPRQDTGGRIRLVYTPLGNLTADTRASYSETRTGFNNTIFDPSNDGSNAIVFKIPFEPNADGITNRSIFDASEKVDFSPGYGRLSSITGYDRYKEASAGVSLPYTPTSTGTQILINDYNSLSEELRFTSPDEYRFRWIAGGYFQHTNHFAGSGAGQEPDGPGDVVFIIDCSGRAAGAGSTNPATSLSCDDIRQDSWAAFAQAAYDITSNLELSGALRYDHDHEVDSNEAPVLDPTGTLNGAAVGTWAPGPAGRERDLTFHKGTPKVTLRWKVTETDMLYGTFANGFKNGGFNPSTLPAAFQTFGQETSTGGETGYKGEFLDRRLDVEASAYYTDVKGYNFFSFNPTLQNQINLNIDEEHIYGAELIVNAKVTPEIKVAASADYAHSETVKYTGDPVFGDPIGKSAPAFPTRQGTLSLDWNHVVANGITLFARSDVQYTGPIFWDLQEQIRRGSVTLLDLRGGFSFQGDHLPWRVEAFCRNCTNLSYDIESVYLAGIGTVHFPSINSLQYGVTISTQF